VSSLAGLEKAFGFYGAVAGLATVLGPLAGGLLIAWNLNGWDC
jgi:hypothetical protein